MRNPSHLGQRSGDRDGLIAGITIAGEGFLGSANGLRPWIPEGSLGVPVLFVACTLQSEPRHCPPAPTSPAIWHFLVRNVNSAALQCTFQCRVWLLIDHSSLSSVGHH
ncbi:hypothetical protein PBY51_003434 [Eleginops maclovinus]|uniref:Uncharacterized protein n=1 Tax=Eleginops maclovinus TaxID=56733 RepID=A0AAN8AWG2_ELEMC|nr:hypothetical protein PBY51_003434 [Eleginops maclovinus]